LVIRLFSWHVRGPSVIVLKIRANVLL